MPETPRQAAEDAARKLRDAIIRAGAGGDWISLVAQSLDAFCDDQRNLDYILVANERDAAIARVEAVEDARLELNNRCLAAEERVRALEAAWRKEVVTAIYNGDDSGTGQWGWYCTCGARWEVNAAETHYPKCALAAAQPASKPCDESSCQRKAGRLCQQVCGCVCHQPASKEREG